MRLESTSFFQSLSKKKIYIYGTGVIADEFYSLLERYNIQDNVVAFIQSKIDKEKQYRNKPVIIPDDVKDEEGIVCICVHESSINDINKELKRNRIENSVSISPILNQLKFGNYRYSECDMSLRDILRHNLSTYYVIVRYLVVRDYYRKQKKWDDVYKKCIGLTAKEKKTVENRLIFFKKLIHRIDIEGYKTNSQIILDNKLHIINGAHRMSILLYKDVQHIPSQIIDVNGESIIGLDKWHKGRIYEEELKGLNLSKEQVNEIKRTQKELAERYNILL